MFCSFKLAGTWHQRCWFTHGLWLYLLLCTVLFVRNRSERSLLSLPWSLPTGYIQAALHTLWFVKGPRAVCSLRDRFVYVLGIKKCTATSGRMGTTLLGVESTNWKVPLETLAVIVTLGRILNSTFFPIARPTVWECWFPWAGGTLFGNLCFFLNVCELVNAHV